jgi:hypothetical protein
MAEITTTTELTIPAQEILKEYVEQKYGLVFDEDKLETFFVPVKQKGAKRVVDLCLKIKGTAVKKGAKK